MIHNIIKHADETPQTAKNPSLYYKAVDIAKTVSTEQTAEIRSVIDHLKKERDTVAKLAEDLETVAKLFHEESVRNTKTNRSVMTVGDDEDEPRYNFKNNNYIILLASMVSSIRNIYSELHTFANGLVPPNLITAKKRVNSDDLDDFDQLNSLFNEMQFNGHSLDRYMRQLATLFNMASAPASVASDMYMQMEQFYKYLLQVHSKDGMRIIKNPVVTNVAMHIFENIDSSGEVNRDNKQVSAYTLRKAETLTSALTNPIVQEFVSDPDKLQYLVRVAVVDLANVIGQMLGIFSPQKDDITSLVGHHWTSWSSDETMPRTQLSMIDSIKFSSVVYHERIDDSGDQLASKMRDETITNIAEMLTHPDVDFNKIVEYVIDRKAELNRFFFEENSFYVCKIGEGNPFAGQAPGALYVEPAERPRGALEDILGSGFDEIRNFHTSIEHASKFHDLFVATSPSKSADKSNVLMVGPMGCGKALPVSEKVLTPDGWVPIGDIKYGDFVIGSDGLPKEVVGVYPQGLREIVSVKFTDGATVRCDFDHLWTVKSGYKNAWHVVTAKQMMENVVLNIPANKTGTRKWSAGLYRQNGTKRLYIPIVQPIQFAWKDLLIDPYTLGAWLGDGHSSQGIICGVEDEIFESVGQKYTQGFKNHESRGYNGLLVQLRELGLLDNKHIPQEYLTASVEQRMELLRGLLDTDGNAGNMSRRTTFANSNERLVDDVVALVRSLGGIAKKGNKRLPKYKYKGEQKTGKPAWQVGIKIPDSLGVPFKNSRKVSEFEAPTKYKSIRMITSIESNGAKEECVCIKIDSEDSLFVTTDYVLTHNTEVLRAVGADRGSIGVFAQGSDFLTCWKGEAEKNPKRLFQEGLKLSRESGRHVHFLIDEIDSLLNNDRDLSGNNNLTLEFQILMDGVVRYPNLSVWGATNHVHRIPMPMIRRFNKVLIVGELDRSDRADLLKRFTSYMPITGKVGDRDWENWAVRLDGATGDVMRKVADHIWREKMTRFVTERPDKAEEMVKLLNDGGKFSVDRFGKEDRERFKRELSKYVIVTASDMEESITDALVNVGIRSEIQTAVATYKSAKEYLESAKEGMRAACAVEKMATDPAELME